MSLTSSVVTTLGRANKSTSSETAGCGTGTKARVFARLRIGTGSPEPFASFDLGLTPSCTVFGNIIASESDVIFEAWLNTGAHIAPFVEYYVANVLTENQRIRDPATFSYTAGVSNNGVRATIDTFAEGTAPPWGEPPYDPPGSEGSWPTAELPSGANPFELSLNRIRSSVAETSGDLLRGVQPVDVSASEAFLLRELPLGGAPQNVIGFVQALRPGAATHIFYPRRKTQEESIDAYQYETKLARLSRTYPETIQKLVSRIRTEDGDVRFGASATAGELLQYVFEEWRSLYSWFTFEPVPELYLRLADSTPLDLNSYLTIETPVLALTQNEERTVSMRQMLERILSLFSGYVLRINAQDNFEIVPPPWAPFAGTGTVQLKREDLYTLENPEIDADSIVNVATINSRWYELVDGEVVAGAVDYYFDFFGSPNPSNWPIDVDNSVPEGELTAYDYVLDDSVVVDDLVIVRGAVQLWRRAVGSSGNAQFTDRREFTLISERGQIKWHEVQLRYQINIFNTVFVNHVIRHRLTTSGSDDIIELVHAGPESAASVEFGYVIELFDAEAEAYVPSSEQRSGQFSDVASAEQYGLSELTIDTDVFELTVEQCESVAEALVVANRAPKTRLRLEQSTWNAFAVQPRHINHLAIIELTDDRDDDLRGVIEAVDYADAYEYSSAQVGSSFTLVLEVPEPETDPDPDPDPDPPDTETTTVVLSTVGAGTWNVPAGVSSLSHVVLVGGGGGGGRLGGGGSGGEVKALTNVAVTPGGTVSYFVGDGGNGSADAAQKGSDGQSTTFGSESAAPGVGGGSQGVDNRAGKAGFNGSGGGSASAGAGAGGVGSSGRNGGNGTNSSPFICGGGAGMGQAGVNGNAGTNPGKGGDGTDLSAIVGTSLGHAGWFGAGGGGGRNSGSDRSAGGQGGGGRGAAATGNGEAGTANTGGGGGGSSLGTGNFGGKGGPGVIILIFEQPV